jgi:hypothetical protein
MSGNAPTMALEPMVIVILGIDNKTNDALTWKYIEECMI